GSTSQGFADVINEDIEIKDDLSWTHGNHNFSVGMDWLRLQYLNRNMYPGSIGFSSTFTSQPLADALFGLVNSMTAQSETIQGGIQHDIFSYVQDNWRATPKMTLNLGLRYEMPFQWFRSELHDRPERDHPGRHPARHLLVRAGQLARHAQDDAEPRSALRDAVPVV